MLGSTRMAQRIDHFYKLVTYPTAHRALMFALGADRALKRYVADILKVTPGIRMLDVGCGPGNIIPYLPAVAYTGIDLNRKHIEFARARYGDRGDFLVGDAVALQETGFSFDLINVSAVLHHLSDDECKTMLKSLGSLLTPAGQIITIDAVRLSEQRLIARAMIEMDSGKNVRTPEQYHGLVRDLPFKIECRLYTDLLRVPYDHFSMMLTTA